MGKIKYIQLQDHNTEKESFKSTTIVDKYESFVRIINTNKLQEIECEQIAKFKPSRTKKNNLIDNYLFKFIQGYPSVIYDLQISYKQLVINNKIMNKNVAKTLLNTLPVNKTDNLKYAKKTLTCS